MYEINDIIFNNKLICSLFFEENKKMKLNMDESSTNVISQSNMKRIEYTNPVRLKEEFLVHQ